MQLKKLDLTPERITMLDAALTQAANERDASLRRIYDDTRCELQTSGDRILLGYAQVTITEYALTNWMNDHGWNQIGQSMIDQLTMTRAEYNEKYHASKYTFPDTETLQAEGEAWLMDRIHETISPA